MGPEDEYDDASASRPVPPPEDRLWRHPSEMGAARPEPAGAFASSSFVAPRSGRRRQRAATVAVVAGVIGAALAVTAIAFVDGLDTRVVEERVIQRVPVRPIVSTPGIDDSEGLRQLLDQVEPTLVEIEATSVEGTFTGAGVIFRDDGYILTSAELVADAGTVAVWMSGRRVKARVVATDSESGIGVVKVDGHDLPTAVLGSSTDLTAGDPAIVVDFSTHGEPVTSIGRVRALNQQVTTATGETRHGMIETDTPVRSRSEGAALWNGSGVVVGIVTGTTSSADPAGPDADGTDGGADTGIDFATGPGPADIPLRAVAIEIARAVADDLIDSGLVRHVWLGVDAIDVQASAEQVALLAAGAPRVGVMVANVTAGSPAEAAGLAPDDVIVAIDHHPVESASALVATIRSHHPGDRIRITYSRDGTHRTVSVTLAERPD